MFSPFRSDLLDRLGALRADRTFAVDRLPQRIDHTADEFLAHWNLKDTPGTFNGIAFGNVFVFAQHYRADGVALQIERETKRIAGKFQHLPLHDVG